MKHTIKLITICLLLTSSTPLFAQTKTFTREYTYRASEDDSKNSCRTQATVQLRTALLREVGTYMRSEQQTITIGNTQNYAEKLEAITAGIVEMKILDEKWNGETYYIKAQMTIDPNDVKQKIEELAEDKQKAKELEESRERTKAAEIEIEQLKKQIAELKKTKGNEQKVEQKINDYNKQIAKLSTEEDYIKKAQVVNITIYQQNNYNTNITIGNIIGTVNNIITAPTEEGFLEKGIKAENNKDYNLAIHYYKEAIKTNPNDIKAYHKLAYVYQNLKDYDNAIKTYKKAISINSYLTDSYVGLGVVYTIMKDYQQAIKTYNQAVKINPNAPAPYLGLGGTYLTMKNYEQAIQNLKKYISLDTANSVAYHFLSQAYFSTDNNKEAVENLIKSAQLGNKDAKNKLEKISTEENDNNKKLRAIISGIYYEEGIQSYDQKNYALAIERFKQTISFAPNDADAYYNLGVTYNDIKNYDKAIESYKKAISIDTNYAEAYTNLGSAYSKIGNKDKQIENYKKAAKLGDKDCQDWLRKQGISW